MLSYLIWKRTFRATCWFENQDPCPTDRYFMIIFWRPPGVLKWSSTFLPLTLQPLEVYLATVQQMKGYIHSFHMRYFSIPCPKRLQRYWFWNFLSESSIVHAKKSIWKSRKLIFLNEAIFGCGEIRSFKFKLIFKWNWMMQANCTVSVKFLRVVRMVQGRVCGPVQNIKFISAIS